MKFNEEKILFSILNILIFFLISVSITFLLEVNKGQRVVRVEDVGVFGIRYELNYGSSFYILNKDTLLPVGSRKIDDVWYTPEYLKKFNKK